ncbi:hypothetical protein AH865_15170 [Salmonella enterica subsp. enterica serovar Infantis]|nr:hypothetical protein [Salmonella enterica subsp. enterica serovar Infantis]EGI5076504.1 hypothetical protein [Salmonella enterica subsp. enterica serovar Infantis]
MRLPYHPLTQQVVYPPDENEELTENEKRETIEIFLLLISRVGYGLAVMLLFFLLYLLAVCIPG